MMNANDGHVTALQEGECILREGEPLTTESKFYIIEAGTVECWKLFEARALPKSCHCRLSIAYS